MTMKLKGKFYRTVARPALLNGMECWEVQGSEEQRMQEAEMHILRYGNRRGFSRKNTIKNQYVPEFRDGHIVS